MAAVVATCRVSKVDIACPSRIKERYLSAAAISSAEFDAYFEGASTAVAIHLSAITTLDHVVTLQQLRFRQRSYNPPQSWHFFDHLKLHELLGGHASHHELSKMLAE